METRAPLTTADKGKGRAGPATMEIGLTKRPEGELTEYKSAQDSKVL